MYFSYDITFCVNEKCENKKCIRHKSHIPIGIPVSISDLRGNEEEECMYKWEEENEDTHNKKRSRRRSKGV